jgi:hypothetical protein
MKKYLLFFGIVIAVVICGGCVSISNAGLYNHSGHLLSITTYSLISDEGYDQVIRHRIKLRPGPYKVNKVNVPAGDHTYHFEIEYQFMLADGQFTELVGLYKLKVQSNQKVWNYAARWIPPEFYKRTGRHMRSVELQIEPDGAIYVLAPNMLKPVTNFPTQPSGYPLRPK